MCVQTHGAVVGVVGVFRYARAQSLTAGSKMAIVGRDVSGNEGSAWYKGPVEGGGIGGAEARGAVFRRDDAVGCLCKLWQRWQGKGG